VETKPGRECGGFLTKLEGTDLYIELAITERPRLADFKFVGVKKGEKDDLETK
jgi:outer membrane protein insertion porin family